MSFCYLRSMKAVHLTYVVMESIQSVGHEMSCNGADSAIETKPTIKPLRAAENCVAVHREADWKCKVLSFVQYHSHKL